MEAQIAYKRCLGGFFSRIYFDNLVRLLVVKLKKRWESLDWVPLEFLTFQTYLYGFLFTESTTEKATY
jgi:hypothetical protein